MAVREREYWTELASIFVLATILGGTAWGIGEIILWVIR